MTANARSAIRPGRDKTLEVCPIVGRKTVRRPAYASAAVAVQEHRGAFGADTFGRIAERIARFFGTPQYIIGQTIVVIAWVILNAFALAGRWDPYPFILLNLAFSLQAAYAAPLILLAQTRQADRDKHMEQSAERRHEEQVRFADDRVAAIKAETDKLTQLLESNTDLTREDKELTEQVAELTKEIRAMLARR
jgi:uncharacterized membrane protein